MSKKQGWTKWTDEYDYVHEGQVQEKSKNVAENS